MEEAQQIAGSSRMKLTPSCSRCRTKKLKCRYAESNPSCCTICLEKGLNEECHRDVRMKRGKRIRLIAGETTNSSKIDFKSFELEEDQINDESSNRRKEIVSLRRKLTELESIERDNSKSITPASSDQHERSSSSLDRQVWPTTDPAGSRKFKKQKQTESVALSLENYVAHGIKASHGGTSSSALPRDVAQNKWQKAASLDERLKLLRAAKQCQFANDEVVVRELVSVFLYRVNHLLGHAIYAPGYRRAVEVFLSLSEEEIVMSKAFVDPCCLATMMLVLCLGYDFHPHNPPPGRSASPGFLAVQAIRQNSIDPTTHWYAIARQSFAVEDSYHLSSIPSLQAACLFLARGKESDGWMRMIHQVAVSSARGFGLHKLGQAQVEPWMQVDDFIRLECGVRIWSYLTMRDWRLSNDEDHLILIHPDQMTTRKPLNLDDEDLEAGMRESKPRSEWTSMSFVNAQIELAQLIKDSAKMQNRTLLKESAEEYLRRLPPFFQLDSQVNSPGLLPVQRWLLHQQLFDLQLRLWRTELTATEGRLHCLDLAEKIIDHQANIRAICPIIDNLQVNFFHLFGACMVVLLDLINQSKGKTKTEQSDRSIARSKILNALDLFQGGARYGRGIRLLRIMLDCEEEIHFAPSHSEVHNLSLLAKRIFSEIKAGTELGQNQAETKKEVWPSFLSFRRIPDGTLLPMVGAWSHISDDGYVQSQDNPEISHYEKLPLSANSFHQSPQSGSVSKTPPTAGTVLDWALGLAFDPFQDRYSTKLQQHSTSHQHHLITPRTPGKPSISHPIQADLFVTAP